MYPNCIKKIFNEGKLEFNDYDTGAIRIKHDPFNWWSKYPLQIPYKKGEGLCGRYFSYFRF